MSKAVVIPIRKQANLVPIRTQAMATQALAANNMHRLVLNNLIGTGQIKDGHEIILRSAQLDAELDEIATVYGL